MPGLQASNSLPYCLLILDQRVRALALDRPEVKREQQGLCDVAQVYARFRHTPLSDNAWIIKRVVLG